MEQWKPIIWYEWLYEVSSKGNIRSLSYHQTWKIKQLKLLVTHSWHSSTLLCKNWSPKMHIVSRLVAIHFIENPDNKPCACHRIETLDENWALYNWFDNLFWWTHSDNANDKYKKWRANNHFQLNHPRWNKWKLWKDSPASKKVNQYTREWVFIQKWEWLKEVERELLISSSSTSQCCNWKRKSAGWFIWKY